MPPPRMPTIIGSTTVSVNSAAMAASIALPPAASISAPAAEASGWLVTTMPRGPVAGCFSQRNVVPARARQSDGGMAGPFMRWPVTMHGGTWCDNRLGPGGSPGAIEQLAVVADGPRHDA